MALTESWQVFADEMMRSLMTTDALFKMSATAEEALNWAAARCGEIVECVQGNRNNRSPMSSTDARLMWEAVLRLNLEMIESRTQGD